MPNIPKGLLWHHVAATFNELGGPLLAPTEPADEYWFALPCGVPTVHYEWLMKAREETMYVALHFEAHKQRDVNLGRLERIRLERAQIVAGIPYGFVCEPYRKDWAQAMFQMPYPCTYHSLAGIRDVCGLMQTFVERTLPTVKAMPRTGSRSA